MKNVGFFFEANYKIGGGHFWRCFNLAKILKKNERKFFFLSKDLDKNYIKILKKEKFNYIRIKSLKNFSELKKKILNFDLNVFVSDYYNLNENLKKKIRNFVRTFVVIDDYSNKRHFCDVFINNNFISNKIKSRIKKFNPNTKLLLGTKYFIQPYKLSIPKHISEKKIKNIFVFFGSSDPSNETTKFIKAIKNFKNNKFFILIGKLNKNYKKIKKLSLNKKNIKIFYNLTNIETIKLMKNKDLSFGAGGINLIERLFLGLPSIVICNANNQKEALSELKNKKVIHFLGYKNKVNKLSIIKCLKNFINKPKLANNLLKKSIKYFKIKNTSVLLREELDKIISIHEK